MKRGLAAERASLGRRRPDGKYEALRAELFVLHTPACEIEVALVDRLATLLWRLRRAALVEAGLIAEAERLAQAARAAGQPERIGEMVDVAFRRNAGTADALLKATRYEGQFDRAYERTLDLLKRVQIRRRDVVRHIEEGGRIGQWVHEALVEAPDAGAWAVETGFDWL